ncbi:hypothetical protein TPHA_0G02400 [Tetrapisispora phaffii CBS 4417]|uniref:Dihydrofolate synthetase n=1 Tax=Tetrapisispora phaffii (strain ATCC 24235 / CBS 4417 / NBRC 1672 / NRRL Y-8282 / UCD 70-5) TaxID=1071381 RepID=G8BVZ7_TETPH|nr:hypothetical protein TPHA_0G02400 [Tetrapisispora phaffii CBS 4417]CCE64075.1 hypothetical protein TPHA_0G02400 [Tetrapisispora phaffii CBS 4417]
MSINLGLSRVNKLLQVIGNPHQRLKIIHVAGTNGKGSVCSYLASLLRHDSIPSRSPKIGKFTTPHMVHITDSICVNDKPIPINTYKSIRTLLEEKNMEYEIKCSEFELLTCAAIKFFEDSSCNICVFEVGLGGRLDATNIIPGSNKLACGITKIGLDHESILGSTLAEIGREKAGIITDGVNLVVVDSSNDHTVLNEIEKRCENTGSQLYKTELHSGGLTFKTDSWDIIKLDTLPLNGHYQAFNFSVALKILDKLQVQKKIYIEKEFITPKYLNDVKWPGRLQDLDFCYTMDETNSPKTVPILLDGAHNGSAAIELEKYLREKYDDNQCINFVIAVTDGKKLEPLLSPLIRPQDSVLVTQFENVDGMPWIKPYDPKVLATFIQENYTKNVKVDSSLTSVVANLGEMHSGNTTPIVICGSLYLCGQLLNINKTNNL